MDLGPVGEWAEQNDRRQQRQNSKHLFLFSSCSHFVQQMNDSLDLLKPAKLARYRHCTIQSGLVADCNLTACNATEDRLRVRIYMFVFNIFSIEFFWGVGRGGPYRRSMDRSVRWSVDPVRWTGPRTGGQCFRVTRPSLRNCKTHKLKLIRSKIFASTKTRNTSNRSVSEC